MLALITFVVALIAESVAIIIGGGAENVTDGFTYPLPPAVISTLDTLPLFLRTPVACAPTGLNVIVGAIV